MQTLHPVVPETHGGRTGRSIAALGVAVLAVGAIVYSGIFEDFSADGMRGRIEAWGAFGPLLFMGIMIAGFFVPAPEIILVAIGGAVFGGVLGFAYAWTAAVIGTALPFLLLRQAVGRHTWRPDGMRFQRLRSVDERIARHGFVTVVVLRLLLYLAPPLGWMLGLTRVKLRDYVLGTAVGIIPGTVMTVYLGDAVTSAGSTAELLAPRVVVPALLMVAFLIVAVSAGRHVFRGDSSALVES